MYMSIARVADPAKLFDALCSAIAGEIAAGDCSRLRRVSGSTYSLVALSCNTRTNVHLPYSTRTTYPWHTTRVQHTAGIHHAYERTAGIQHAYNIQLAYNTHNHTRTYARRNTHARTRTAVRMSGTNADVTPLSGAAARPAELLHLVSDSLFAAPQEASATRTSRCA